MIIFLPVRFLAEALNRYQSSTVALGYLFASIAIGIMADTHSPYTFVVGSD